MWYRISFQLIFPVSLSQFSSSHLLSGVRQSWKARLITSTFPDEGYYLFAWDTVDITFAAIVGSLPAFSSLIERLTAHTVGYIFRRGFPSAGDNSARLRSSLDVFLHPRRGVGKRATGNRDTTDCERLEDEFDTHDRKQRMMTYAMNDVQAKAETTDGALVINPDGRIETPAYSGDCWQYQTR